MRVHKHKKHGGNRKNIFLLIFNITYNCMNKYYILLDFVTFVHVFYKKKRFVKFKTSTKKQSLLCKSNLILIKS